MKRAKIEDALISMGVPAGNKGFHHIVDSIEIISEKGMGIGITKELYPAVAKKNGTSPQNVERTIRHAFGIARSKKADRETVNHYIGFENCNNSSSLMMLYMMLKRESSGDAS